MNLSTFNERFNGKLPKSYIDNLALIVDMENNEELTVYSSDNDVIKFCQRNNIQTTTDSKINIFKENAGVIGLFETLEGDTLDVTFYEVVLPNQDLIDYIIEVFNNKLEPDKLKCTSIMISNKVVFISYKGYMMLASTKTQIDNCFIKISNGIDGNNIVVFDTSKFSELPLVDSLGDLYNIKIYVMNTELEFEVPQDKKSDNVELISTDEDYNARVLRELEEARSKANSASKVNKVTYKESGKSLGIDDKLVTGQF